MGEFENDNKKNSEFKAPTSETETSKVKDKVEKDLESRIGKPDESREATAQEKVEAQRVLVENIQKRVEGMKTDLAKMEEKTPQLAKAVESQEKAQRLEQELADSIRNRMASENPHNVEKTSKEEALQVEITTNRETAKKIQDEEFGGLPVDQGAKVNLAMKLEDLKADIAKQEDILEANQKELAEMSKS